MQHHSGDVKHYTIQYMAAVSRVTGPCDTVAVSLVSFNCGTAAVPVAHTELQATNAAAVARVTATCDMAAVSLGSAY